VKRDRGPEEFFEVFREVQASKKRRDDEPAADAEEPRPAPEPEAFEPAGPPPTLAVSYPVAAACVVGALLLIVAAYLLGKQAGWRAYDEAMKRPGRRAGTQAAADTRLSPGVISAEPELVDGKVFTLITYGSSRSNEELAEAEVEYLNAYEPFRALGVQAYTYRDRNGKYRLCARGLAGRRATDREDVKAKIRKLRSRRSKLDYSDAEFYAP
jgi:hypothetical protein